MPIADLGDYKLFYKEFSPNKKNTLLFLHGFTLDNRMWDADAEYFKKEYRVITLDMKGHGKSDSPKSGYSRADRVSDVIKFMDALELKRVHLVGLSYGGTTGLGIALHHPDRLHSLTLISTSAAGYSAGPKISRIDKLFKEKGFDFARAKWIDTSLMWYKDDKIDIKNLMVQMMSEHSYIPWMDPMRGKYKRESDLDKVSGLEVPTLIIAGRLDKIFLPLAEMLKELIPSSRLIIYENTGHMVNLEAPGKFREDVLKFFQSI